MADWINVKDKLPETQDEVVVLANYVGAKENGLFYTGIATYSPTLRVWFKPDDLDCEDIVIRYWLPLPEFPKEEK